MVDVTRILSWHAQSEKEQSRVLRNTQCLVSDEINIWSSFLDSVSIIWRLCLGVETLIRRFFSGVKNSKFQILIVNYCVKNILWYLLKSKQNCCDKMELPHLGKHCSEKTCRLLDFLPMKCDACGQIFCKDHLHYDDHNCSSSYKKNIQVNKYQIN